MTCKDCIHCEICDYWYKEAYHEDSTKWCGSVCRDFKNKNNLIEVPCIIGQECWRLMTWHIAPAELIKSKVSMLQQKADKSWKFRISNHWGTCDFKAEDVGTCVFFDEAEAKMALANINKEDTNLK